MSFKNLCPALAATLWASAAVAAPHTSTGLPPGVLHAPSHARWQPESDFTPSIKAAKLMLTDPDAGYALQSFSAVPSDYTIKLSIARPGMIETVQVSDKARSASEGDYVIERGKENGVNTPFVVKKPEGYTVLAARRLICHEGRYREVIYTPFTSDLDTPAMRSLGFDYLHALLEEAYMSLFSLEVRSQAVSGKLAASVVPVDTVFPLLILEHLDPLRVKHERIENLIDEILVTVAANREDAYEYAVSSTGARGLLQLMPATYEEIRRQYPAADLDPDFVAGMKDQVNALKAAILLLDSNLVQIPVEKREEAWARYDIAWVSCRLSGGCLQRWWSEAAASLHHHRRLAPETRGYVAELHKVRKALRL